MCIKQRATVLILCQGYRSWQGEGHKQAKCSKLELNSLELFANTLKRSVLNANARISNKSPLVPLSHSSVDYIIIKFTSKEIDCVEVGLMKLMLI